MTDSKRFYLLMVILYVLILLGCEKPELKPCAGKVETFLPIAPKSVDTISFTLATTYNATAGQCDSNPNRTADGSYIDPVKLRNKEIHWVALSRDWIWDDYRQTIYEDTTHWRGRWKFGDTIRIKSELRPDFNGEWIVHDCKSDSCTNSIDFLFDPVNNVPKLGRARDFKTIVRL